MLLRFYNRFIRGSQDLLLVRHKYESTIKAVIGRSVEQGYFLGLDILQKQIPDFTKNYRKIGEDIQELVDKLNNDFWTLAAKNLKRETEFVLNLKTSQLEQKPEFDTEAATLGLSIFMAYAAYNLAISENAIGKVKFIRRNPPEVDPIICEPFRNKVFDITDPNLPQLPLHRHCRCLLVPVIT